MSRLLLFALGLVFATAAQAQVVWKYSAWLPPTHAAYEGFIKVWAKQVEDATQGRVKIDIVPPLGTPQAHYDLVRNGVADVTNITTANTANRFPLLKGLEMPFLSDQNSAMSIAAWRTYERFFAAANEFEGVKLGGLFIVGPYQVYTTKKEIRAIDDLKGQKIREAGGMTKEVVEALGATPFFAPAPQTYDVLSKGVGDGVLFPPESIPGFKVTSAVRHGLHVAGGFNQAAQALIINEAKWKALSPADQAAIEKLLGEHTARLWGELWDKTNAAAVDTMRKEGVGITTAAGPLLAEIQKRLGAIEGAWLAEAQKKNVDGKAALAFMRDEVKKLEKR
jgi:TRAP-type C4-dicarboxylate transport system substrate-binding protein